MCLRMHLQMFGALPMGASPKKRFNHLVIVWWPNNDQMTFKTHVHMIAFAVAWSLFGRRFVVRSLIGCYSALDCRE